MKLCDTAVLSILLHSKHKFRGEPSESAKVSPLSIFFVQVSPKEVDNPSVSAIREAREEAGVIGNEKRERRQRWGEGVEYDIPTRLWPLFALQFCDQASLVVFSGCLRTLKEDTGRGSL